MRTEAVLFWGCGVWLLDWASVEEDGEFGRVYIWREEGGRDREREYVEVEGEEGDIEIHITYRS